MTQVYRWAVLLACSTMIYGLSSISHSVLPPRGRR